MYVGNKLPKWYFSLKSNWMKSHRPCWNRISKINNWKMDDDFSFNSISMRNTILVTCFQRTNILYHISDMWNMVLLLCNPIEKNLYSSRCYMNICNSEVILFHQDGSKRKRLITPLGSIQLIILFIKALLLAFKGHHQQKNFNHSIHIMRFFSVWIKNSHFLFFSQSTL